MIRCSILSLLPQSSYFTSVMCRDKVTKALMPLVATILGLARFTIRFFSWLLCIYQGVCICFKIFPIGNEQIRLEIRPNPLRFLLNSISKLVETILRLDRDLLGRVPSVLKNLLGRVVSLTSLLGGESGKDVDLDLELVELGRSERRGSEEVGKSVY